VQPEKPKPGTTNLEQTIKEAENTLADTKQRGTMFLATMYVWTHWMDGLRRSHSWISVFFPPKDEQLAMSRPQRIIILLSVILAGMASNAVFFGYNPDNVGAKVRHMYAANKLLQHICTTMCPCRSCLA
jgi:hypothetical protein